MDAHKKLDLSAIATIPIIMTLANSMLIPVLPLMEKKMNISSTQASLIITVYAAVAIIFIPIAGYLSDRIGRKKVIIPSLLLAAIGGAVSGLAAWLMKDNGYWVVLLGRFIQGIGAAGAFPIVLPLVGDLFKSEEDVSSGLGLIETSNTLGKVLSPVLGSALALIVWYLPLLVIPFICLVSLFAVLFMVKEPSTAKSKGSSFRKYMKDIKTIFQREGRWLFAIFLIGGISMFVIFGFLFYLSEILEIRYRIDGIWKGLLLSIPLSAICASSFIGGKVAQGSKKRMKWMSCSGMLLLAAAMLCCAIINPDSRFVLLGLMFAAGIGVGLALPCLDALITEGIEKNQRGIITALYSSMRFIGVAGGPLFTAVLIKHDVALFYTFTGISTAAGLLALLAVKPDEEPQSQGSKLQTGESRV
ncbi:MFS transporter [Paenibacillaceae bacterium]|nr:MFS transporter [Paenibacillaceae bacterium]